MFFGQLGCTAFQLHAQMKVINNFEHNSHFYQKLTAGDLAFTLIPLLESFNTFKTKLSRVLILSKNIRISFFGL